LASVSWSDPALQDLREVCRFIGRGSSRFAAIFADRAFVATDRLGTFPLSGRTVPQFERDDVREVFLGNYRIMYHVLPNEVEVIAVIHGARQVSGEILDR